MTLKRLGALRYAGDDFTPDFAALPTGAAFQGATFDATDVGEKYVHNGTNWIQFEGGSGGGITGLEPNSTILEYSTEIDDYTTPTSASATSAESSADFKNNYDSNVGWTQVGTLVTVDDGAFPDIVKANLATSGVDRRVHHDIGFTISDTEWVAQFDAIMTETVASSNFYVFALTAGTSQLDNAITNQDMISLQSGAPNDLFPTVKDGSSSTQITGDAFTYVNGVHYWFRVTRLSATSLQFQVFTDSARLVEVHNTTSTISAAITGLTTLQHGTDAVLAGARPFTLDGDNFELFNNTTIPTIGATNAIDGNTATFWESEAGINESITLDMGSVVNCYGLAFFIDKAQSGITETQFQIIAGAPLVATGGDITQVGDFKVHTFNVGGNFEITSGSGNVEYLVIGGGGGAGQGGGGAGAYRTDTGFSVTPQIYPITVGAGGATGGIAGAGNVGSDSIFDSITSNGGAGGGTINTSAPAYSANGSGSGSGGGTGTVGSSGGAFGNDGGDNANAASPFPSGGGGGAGAVGAATTSGQSGTGGDGLQSNIDGLNLFRSGGGAGR